mmetsp:Transcript_47648/g.146861  ORF Transcript_47648/g.146861 Transcript_47648/m.146861 type:complete len:207 (+) Transcript_47648:316-936(+)
MLKLPTFGTFIGQSPPQNGHVTAGASTSNLKTFALTLTVKLAFGSRGSANAKKMPRGFSWSTRSKMQVPMLSVSASSQSWSQKMPMSLPDSRSETFQFTAIFPLGKTGLPESTSVAAAPKMRSMSPCDEVTLYPARLRLRALPCLLITFPLAPFGSPRLTRRPSTAQGAAKRASARTRRAAMAAAEAGLEVKYRPEGTTVPLLPRT